LNFLNFLLGTSSIHIRSDDRIIASSHWDKTIRLFDRKKMKCLAILRYHNEVVTGVKFARKQNDNNPQRKGWFASCSKDGQIALWDLFADTYLEQQER
jgi:WD40 repeat protein